MTTEPETVTVDPEMARRALGDALAADAAASPSAPPPPRKERPPDATPEAPWGFKADGTPRKGPPGPGRPRTIPDGADKPRVTDQPLPSAPSGGPANLQPAAGADYSDQIGGALTMVWMGMAGVPWTRAHAAVLRNSTPSLVPAWNSAAQQNATVRRYVLKLSGEGSWAWVIPVTIATTPLVMAMWQVTRDPELRATLAAQTEKEFTAFITEQARAAGMDIPDQDAAPPAQESAQEAA